MCVCTCVCVYVIRFVCVFVCVFLSLLPSFALFVCLSSMYYTNSQVFMCLRVGVRFTKRGGVKQL